jgi:hypothetical protein
MVRPERRDVRTGARPARESAGAPDSRLQPGGEIRPVRAERQRPFVRREASQRAATIRERKSLVTLMDTVRYPAQVTPRRPSLSRVPVNGMHSLKGGSMAPGRLYLDLEP